jgi:hypothetical protein
MVGELRAVALSLIKLKTHAVMRPQYHAHMLSLKVNTVFYHKTVRNVTRKSDRQCVFFAALNPLFFPAGLL